MRNSSLNALSELFQLYISSEKSNRYPTDGKVLSLPLSINIKDVANVKEAKGISTKFLSCLFIKLFYY